MKCVVKMEEIPDALIINWDQTAMKIVPSSSWTMEKRGTKRVEIVAIDDKRQITAVFGCSLSKVSTTTADIPRHHNPVPSEDFFS